MTDPTFRTTRRTSLRYLAAALGALVGLAAVMLFWVLSFRDPLPPLSVSSFETAQKRWREQGPASYDIEVEVSGRQPAKYRVEVRDGEAVSATRNGQPLTQRRTWTTWSVPGMFGTMESDFQHMKQVAEGVADEQTPRLALYGEFHPQYGYPQRYRRVGLGQTAQTSVAHQVGRSEGADSAVIESEVAWIVREFTPRPTD